MPIKDHKSEINKMIDTYVAKKFSLKFFHSLPANERKLKQAQLDLFDAVITDLKTLK